MIEPKISEDDLMESIVAEFTTALRQGKHPAIEVYQSRYPKLSTEIAEVLSSVVMIEQLKSTSDTSSSQRRLLEDVSKIGQIGPYKILREVGRGGMGVVFAAVHEPLGRQVAIKVLPTPLVDSQTYIERFHREAQVAARLHHTNIVGVFEAGEGPGYHYYVMDFVDGLGLNFVIGRIKKSTVAGSVANAQASKIHQLEGEYFNGYATNRFRWSARLAIQMADALSHAHACEILHRDIKPSNMILDTSGRVWLTDFGLAKDNSQVQALTKTGDVIGTPQYLPPESLELKYDIRSETYGVGLVLYEMIALQPAYSGTSPAELIRAIASRAPQAICKLVSDIPVDLSTIVEKAIAREPSHRYQTAAELSRDLMAFLEDRPISARRPAVWETAYRWAKRNPLAATLSAISAMLLGLVAVSASIGYVTTTTALKKEAQVSRSLRGQQQQTEQAKQAAEQNFQAMKLQYDRAEANVALSIEAFDEIFQHLISRGNKGSVDQDIEGLREISGIETSLTTEDAKFLDGMVKFYERFATLNAGNETLKAESAKAYRRVGNIYQIVGQLQPAIEAYEKSLKLSPVEPGAVAEIDKEELLTRVRTQNELSAAHRLSGHFMQAQEWNTRSIRMLENFLKSKTDSDIRLELARTMSTLGFDVLRALSNSARLTNNRPPIPDRPTAPDRPAAFEIGKRMWERVNKPLIAEAIKILDELILEDPDNGEYVAVRASCYWSLAAADLPRDQANGFENRNKAIAALDELVIRQPDIAEYQYLLALACSLTLFNSDDQSQELDEEWKLVERGARISTDLIEQHANVLDYHHLHARLKIKLAGYDIQQKRRDRAFELLLSAQKSIQVLASRASSNRSFSLVINALARELVQLDTLYREVGNYRMSNEVGQILKQIQQLRK